MTGQSAKDRVGQLAGRQRGRIAWRQLRQLGVAKTTIEGWVKSGYLLPGLPHVYAVGHDAPGFEADLAAAVLYAGPGAALSHVTALWWWGLIDNRPAVIEVSTRRRCRTCKGLEVHARRPLERVWHKRLPVTTVAQTLLDFASNASLNRVRVALANAEYRRLLDVNAVQALLGPGRAGSTTLRTALERHQPRLAYARSPVEVAVFELCERYGIELPEVNRRIAGWTVDFLWRAEGVVVEADPPGNHHTPAQIDRDRRKDLALRARGLAVNRYSREQVEKSPDQVAADVIATLERRRAA